MSPGPHGNDDTCVHWQAGWTHCWFWSFHWQKYNAEYQLTHPSSDSALLFCLPFLLISMLTSNVLPTSSCVCCLIAEPPSPRPWDPPGSMYHLLCHTSLSSPLSSSCPHPLFFFFFSHVCLPPCAPLITGVHTLPTIIDKMTPTSQFNNCSSH